MTSARMDFVPLDRSFFRRSLAESLSSLLGQRYNTAKQIARAIGIEPVTAENLRRGKLSVTTLEKALLSEGRELWNRLGDELFGETFYDFEKRRIASAFRELEGAESNLVQLHAEGQELLSRASAVEQASLREVALSKRGVEGGTWQATDGRSAGGTRGSRDRGAR